MKYWSGGICSFSKHKGGKWLASKMRVGIVNYPYTMGEEVLFPQNKTLVNNTKYTILKQLGESGKLKQDLSFLSHILAVSPFYLNYLAFNSTLNFPSLVRFGCLMYPVKVHFLIDFTLISFPHCSLGVCVCFSFLFPFQIHESGKVVFFPLTQYFLGP